MVKNSAANGKGITHGVLIKELRAFEQRLGTEIHGVEKRLNDTFEKRLDEKLAIQTETLKDYVNAGFTQVNLRFERLEKKLDVSVEGLVEMISRESGQLKETVK